jgi:hypothetical protein
MELTVTKRSSKAASPNLQPLQLASSMCIKTPRSAQDMRSRTKQFKKETIETMEGVICICRDKLDNVLRRSGADGIIIGSTEHDDSMILLTVPPEANNIDKAFELALSMGKLAYGVTMNKYGLRIRAKSGTEHAARRAMAPEMARLVGKALFECKKADGLVYHANGVPHTMSDADLVRALTIISNDENVAPWTCVPFARVNGSDWGRKTLVVKALVEPTKHTSRIDYLGRKYVIHLIEQERKLDVLDRAAERRSKEEEKYFRDNECKQPSPKTKAQPVQKPMNVDEDGDQDEAE